MESFIALPEKGERKESNSMAKHAVRKSKSISGRCVARQLNPQARSEETALPLKRVGSL